MLFLKILIWKLKFTAYAMRKFRDINPAFSWKLACACLENVDYDLTEKPADCFDEEISCWSE